jgi:hypothetical protein
MTDNATSAPWRPCATYCEHGGVCELSSGHDGKHDSGYCQWTDEQAISREEADRRLIGKDPIMGPAIAGMQSIAEVLLESGDADDD